MSEKKQLLIEIVGLSKNELKDKKIGILVRSTLPIILSENMISDLEISKLQDTNYSKLTFDLNYPVLKKYQPKLSLEQNRTVSNYTRYYANTFKNNNTDYLICSEWYERSIEQYINWLKRKIVV
jgi:hypothetical protein